MADKIVVMAQRATRDIYSSESPYNKIGSEVFDFVIEIDEKSLYALAGRAARNKKGRAQRGGLVAKVTSRRAL